MTINKLPLRWYGTKYNLVGWLHDKMPLSRRYVDVFGGSAITLVKREPVEIEVYNDLNESLVNYFRILREHPDFLKQLVEQTPYSRKELDNCLKNYDNPALTDLERARCFFVSCEAIRGTTLPNNSSGQQFSREKKSDATTSMRNRPEMFSELSERLQSVQIENRPAKDIIEMYSGEETTFYLDPPYVADSRASASVYDDEMSDDEHRDLIETVKDSDGYFAISGYYSDLYDELLSDWNIYSREINSSINREEVGEIRTNVEVLWTNYDAEEIGGEYIGNWNE